MKYLPLLTALVLTPLAASAAEGLVPAPAPAKAAKPSPLTGEEERATFTLPPGFEIELVAQEEEGVGKFVPIAFDQKGALWTTTALEYPVDGNENPAAADALYASKAKDKVLVYDRDPKSPTGYSPKPRVFAEGLAIPLGVLPYKNGCYVQHGHDIAFLEDTDGDGKADKRTVTLTGFGVQDSHLFPHQFMRAPGGWIWMAQGAFNYSKVRRPDEPAEKAVQFDQTRMAKFRPDGSGFDITSNGPCNIWGLVLNGEGEAFIQEANDYGYPVMPFHEYANYPGCSDRQMKTYAPKFPPAAPDFKMGGTGLSGLALTDKAGPFPEPWRDVMLVANPITNRIQGIKMHRDGPYWKLDKPVDFLRTSDEWFRPVAITTGPDGCLYIVDWYNKVISHNEVARNHPDRDKIRGRIWRVKATAQKPFDVPDFTKLTGDELIAKLGGPSLAQSHLAWQALADRMSGTHEEFDGYRLVGFKHKVLDVMKDKSQSASRRIGAMFALTSNPDITWVGGFVEALHTMIREPDRNIRREALRTCPGLVPTDEELDPEVRARIIKNVGSDWVEAWATRETWIAEQSKLVSRAEAEAEWRTILDRWLTRMLSFACEPLAAPIAPSTSNGKPIKVREAYDREFERYLVRMFLEKHPDAVAKFLDSPEAAKFPVEARLLATLALEPKASAARVAQLLPKLTRGPGQEEVLRLAQFPGEPGVGEALKATLQNPATRTAALEALLAVRTKLDAAKLTPFLADAATALLASKAPASLDLGVKLAAGFKLTNAEPALVALLERVGWASRPPDEASRVVHPNVETPTNANPRADVPRGTPARAGGTPTLPGIIRSLTEIGSANTELFAKLATTAPDAAVRDEALAALAASRAADAPARVLALYPKLAPAQRRTALDKLTTTKPGAAAIVAALTAGTVPKTDLDAAALDRLQAVLGATDPALNALVDSLAALFRPVLALDGSDAAWSETGVTLDGPFTVETWVLLNPKDRAIGPGDGILGVPGQLCMNFFGGTFRIWNGTGDAIVAKKPTVPGVWIHLAVTRDEKGALKIYQDGEIDQDQGQPLPQKFENVRIASTNGKGGLAGALSEFRIWNRTRTADEIRNDFDRSFEGVAKPAGLIFCAPGAGPWGKLQSGAKVAKTSDFPPILTAAEAAALDAKFAKYRALADQPGDVAKGRVAAQTCLACHTIAGQGGNLAPNLSGAGAMGVEALLRNLITPNAAMENGYRLFRVELKSGDLVEGFLASEDQDAVILRAPGAQDRRIARAEIRATQFLRRSIMPEALLDTMTPEQVSDMFTYLKTLK